MPKRLNQQEAKPEWPGEARVISHREKNEGAISGPVGEAARGAEQPYQVPDVYNSAEPARQGGQK